jgi:hypothetical protein
LMRVGLVGPQEGYINMACLKANALWQWSGDGSVFLLWGEEAALAWWDLSKDI